MSLLTPVDLQLKFCHCDLIITISSFFSTTVHLFTVLPLPWAWAFFYTGLPSKLGTLQFSPPFKNFCPKKFHILSPIEETLSLGLSPVRSLLASSSAMLVHLYHKHKLMPLGVSNSFAFGRLVFRITICLNCSPYCYRGKL